MNTCAIRMSYALNECGIKIPNIPGKTRKGKIKSDGTYDYYFTFANDINQWMRKTFGTTNNQKYIYRDLDDYQGNENQYGKGFQADVLSKKGIFAMLPIDKDDFGASGHCDKFDGVDCKAGCYFQDALEIHFWELP